VAELRQLLQQFGDIFAESSYDIKKTGLIEHDIDTEGHGPIRNRAYRTPLKLQDELKRHLNEMIKNGIIQESQSPWAAPVLLVKKSNGNETRFVTDYRALNKITKHNSWPLQRVEWILEQLGNKKMFSTIDWPVDLSHGVEKYSEHNVSTADEFIQGLNRKIGIGIHGRHFGHVR